MANQKSISFGLFQRPGDYFKVTLLISLLPRNWDSIQSTQKVCQLITDEFLTTVNEESCQFNVYIVKGQNGFTEQTIKNMLGLIWTFESSIDTMHERNQDRELRQSMHKC